MLLGMLSCSRRAEDGRFQAAELKSVIAVAALDGRFVIGRK
jgi:hypothetical protein